MVPNLKIGFGVLLLGLCICLISVNGNFLNHCGNTAIESPQIKTANETCQKELNLTATRENPLPWKDSKCFKVCVVKKLGMIGSDDKISTSGVNSFIDAAYPAAVRSALKTAISSCSMVGLDTDQSAEDKLKCKQYKPLMKCLKKPIKAACKELKTSSIAMEGGHVVAMLGQANSTTVQVVNSTSAGNSTAKSSASGNDDDDDDEDGLDHNHKSGQNQAAAADDDDDDEDDSSSEESKEE